MREAGGTSGVAALVAGLMAVITVNALFVVIAAHDSRQLWRQLQQEKRVEAELEMEWKRLMLERGARRGHSRIERIARSRLDMVMPEAENVVIVRTDI